MFEGEARMTAAATRLLTERQQAVMELIDRRVPIKVIAQDLGVSETRINQHIRALKDIYRAESLNELVEIHRAASGFNALDGNQPGATGFSILEARDSASDSLIRSDPRKVEAQGAAKPCGRSPIRITALLASIGALGAAALVVLALYR